MFRRVAACAMLALVCAGLSACDQRASADDELMNNAVAAVEQATSFASEMAEEARHWQTQAIMLALDAARLQKELDQANERAARLGACWPTCQGDANFDGTVNFDDNNAVIANWGMNCEASPLVTVRSVHNLLPDDEQNPGPPRCIAIFDCDSEFLLEAMPNAKRGGSRRLIRTGPGEPWPEETKLIQDWMFYRGTAEAIERAEFLAGAITEAGAW